MERLGKATARDLQRHLRSQLAGRERAVAVALDLAQERARGENVAVRFARTVSSQRSRPGSHPSPRKPKGLSHCIFECLIVEGSSQAQNHLSILADRYTERCRGVFDCFGDG
jgi:hypothetical protein